MTDVRLPDPARVSPEHPDLQAFFAHVRGQANGTVEPAAEAVVEVNLFLLQDGSAQLFWSGAALTTAVDGKGGGLRDLSGQVADALKRAQRRLRGD